MAILKDKQKIINWLELHNVKNYEVVQKPLSDQNKIPYVVNVYGDVDISNRKLKSIDVQFGVVEGFFDCSINQLTSLKGCPLEVKTDFACGCNKLSSLQYGPVTVGSTYYCFCNQLTSLKYLPKNSLKYFDCSNNRLKSLDGIYQDIEIRLNCSNNKLTSFKYADHCTIKELVCYANPLKTLMYFFKNIRPDEQINIEEIDCLQDIAMINRVMSVE